MIYLFIKKLKNKDSYNHDEIFNNKNAIFVEYKMGASFCKEVS